MTRAQRLINAMGISQNQAVLLHNPSNMFYISGYTGEGLVMIAPEKYAIITDFRYTEQAGQQSPDFTVYMTEKNKTHNEIVQSLCAQMHIDTVYYEDDYLTVRAFEQLRETVKGAQWRSVNGAPQLLRQLKDEGELALIEQACKLTGDAFERLLPQIKEGMTEKELALLLEFDMLTHGAQSLAFSTIVASGENGSLPHAVPGTRKIRHGDMITFDFGAKVGGYCADMTRTVAFGEPSSEMKKVYEVVLEAQKRTQDAVKPGVGCREIDAVARDYIYAQGYEGRFGHGLGHSLGIDIHEDPRFSLLGTGVTKVGHVMTVEPGVYLPGVGGVRIENTVIVTEDGCRALTLPTRELIIL